MKWRSTLLIASLFFGVKQLIAQNPNMTAQQQRATTAEKDTRNGVVQQRQAERDECKCKKKCKDKCKASDVNKVKVLKLDYNNTDTFTLKPLSRIRKGDLYRIEISNINLNVQNVTIGKSDSTIKSEVKFPTFDLLGLDIIKSVIEGINISTISKSAEQAIGFYEEHSQELGGFDNKNVFSELFQQNQVNKNNLISMLDNATAKRYQDLIAAMARESKKEKISKEIATNQQTVINILSDAKRKFESTDDLIFDVNLQTISYAQGWTSEPNVGILDGRKSRSLQEIVRDSDNSRREIKEVRTQLETLEADYKKFKESDPDFAKLYEDDVIKKQDAALTGDLTKAKEAVDKVLEKVSPAKIVEYTTTLVRLENNKDRKFISLPFQHHEDLSKITLTVTDKLTGVSQTANYIFPLDNFYAGIGGSFYYGNFKHDVYSIRETAITDSTSHFSLVDEGSQRGEVGVAVLLHVGKKVGDRGFGFHGTIGPALSIAHKPLPRIAAGGGISFGKRNGMLSFDILCMAGNVNVKSKLFDSPNQVSSQRPESATVTRLKASWGLSMGYIYKF